MDKSKLFDALKDYDFVSEFVKTTCKEDMVRLFSEYGMEIGDKESAEMAGMLKSIKCEIAGTEKVSEHELTEISGGKSNIGRKISKPFYYLGYGPGYVVGKVPVVGYTVYHSVKDAILGFYDALHNS